MQEITLFFKSDGLSEEEFVFQAIERLAPYSRVGNFLPIVLSSNASHIYAARAMTRPVEELGFKSVMPELTRDEFIYIRNEVEGGNLSVLDYKRNQIYSAQDSLMINQGVAPDLNDINNELIEYLSLHPEMMQRMDWRKFEILVETLLKAKGYDTQLGPGSGDGGVDIRMISNSEMAGKLLTLVQVKKYSDGNKIQLQPVQALYGAVECEKASKGLFVTTSTFLPCARKFAESNAYRLALADKYDLRDWLRKYNS